MNLLSSLLGGRGTIEADLLIGRSHAVIASVAQRLHQQGRYRGMSLNRLESRLRNKMTIESVRGSILHVSIEDHDPVLAAQIVDDFVFALRSRLTTLSREQASAKQAIAQDRLDDATRIRDQKQRILLAYRADHHFSSPDAQLGFGQVTEESLKGQLEGVRATLLVLQRTEGPDNVQVQYLKDRIQILERQIAEIQKTSGHGSIQSLAQLNPEVTEYNNLVREEGYAEGQYDVYKRYLESVTVQEAAAPLNMDIIDPPFVDPHRHFNILPLGLFALLMAFALFAEAYIPSAQKFRAS